MPTTVEHLYNDYKKAKAILEEKSEPGLSTELDSTYKKVLVLAAASQFETEICTALLTAVNKRTPDNRPLRCLLGTAFTSKSYYRLFNWGKKDVLGFFEPFGGEFKEWYDQETKKNKEIVEFATSFVELSKLRNEVVHKNFAEYEGLKHKTAEEIYTKYQASLLFLKEIKMLLE